jgi:hypothetical protein
MRRPQRILVLLVVAACVSAATAVGAAPARKGAVRFVSVPRTAHQGKDAQVVATVKSGTSGFSKCSLAVRYANGHHQAVGFAYASGGRATWDWHVPTIAKPGRAKLTASCAGVGRATQFVRVVGRLTPPTIDVVKQGFSIRPEFSGNKVSFGLLLKNPSPNADALKVYVLVNFLEANGHTLGTSSGTVDAISAGGTYAYGGSLSFPGAAPIVQLEVATQVGDGQPHANHQPQIDNVTIVPGRTDANWVGEVDGELINDQASLNLKNAKLSTVVFDAAGNIIGGGTSSAYALLPPGTREAFAIKSDVDAIPYARAASAMVSPLATYTP